MLAAFLKASQPLLCQDPLVVEVMSAQVSPVGAGQAFAVVHLPCCYHKNLIMP
jgi:hypothetical protein